ncbi:MAG: hypothetical protein PVI59_15820 [Anaerolineae bacterium]
MADFISAVANALDVSPVTAAFAVGGVVIGLAVGVVGWIANRMGVWRDEAAAPDEPQQAYTTQTPRQVVQTGRTAQRNLACCQLLIALAIVAGGVLLLRMTGWLDEVLTWAGQFLVGQMAP